MEFDKVLMSNSVFVRMVKSTFNRRFAEGALKKYIENGETRPLHVGSLAAVSEYYSAFGLDIGYDYNQKAIVLF